MEGTNSDFDLAGIVQEEITKASRRSSDEEQEKISAEAFLKIAQIHRYISLLGNEKINDSTISDANLFLTALLDNWNFSPDSTNHQLSEAIVQFAIFLYPHLNNLSYWSIIDSSWDKLIPIATAVDDINLLTQTLTRQAISKSNLGDYGGAINIYDNILHPNILLRLSDDTIAEVLFQKGVSLYRRGDTDESKSILLESLGLCHKHNLIVTAANVLIQLGNISIEQNDFNSALKHYKNSLDQVSSVNGAESLACMAYQSIGRTYVLDKKYKESIPYLEKAVQLRRERYEQSELAHVKIDLAAAYLECGNITDAEILINEAMTACTTAFDFNGEALCRITKGRFLQNKGLLSEAFTQWEEALNICFKHDMPKIELSLYSQYIPALLISGKISKVIRLIPRIIKVIRRINMKLSTILGFSWRLLIGAIKRI